MAYGLRIPFSYCHVGQASGGRRQQAQANAQEAKDYDRMADWGWRDRHKELIYLEKEDCYRDRTGGYDGRVDHGRTTEMYDDRHMVVV